MPTTIGIDLAADGRKTSVCMIDWQGDRKAAIHFPQPPKYDWTDDELVALIEKANSSDGATVGIDCPLGWPKTFVETVKAHQESAELPTLTRYEAHDETNKTLDTRRYRLTDDLTWKATGIRPPLSVSTNLLGVVALRLAEILARLRVAAIDRSGASGPIAEVHPAAALARWGLPIAPGTELASYKTGLDPQGVRAAIVEEIAGELSTEIVFDDAERARCVDSHDDLDAFICGLVARAVQLGETNSPKTEAELSSARTEGWIHLPNEDSLGLLA